MFSNTLTAEERVKENLYHLLDIWGITSSPGKWKCHHRRRYLKDMMLRDMVYSGEVGSAGLNLMILKLFSNLNDSIILFHG